MMSVRLHLLAQAALCFEQAGRPAEAARCREKAGEPAAAAALYRTAGDLAKAAGCYRRAGRIDEATGCLLALGRPQDAAQLWEEAGEQLEAAWVLTTHGGDPLRARALLAEVTPGALGETLRHQLASTLCGPAGRRSEALAAVVKQVQDRFPDVTPASEQARLLRWAVQAADTVGRPDLGAVVFAAAYRSRLRGTPQRWQEWARVALGGTAGVPDQDL